jgi:hypothetical protein
MPEKKIIQKVDKARISQLTAIWKILWAVSVKVRKYRPLIQTCMKNIFFWHQNLLTYCKKIYIKLVLYLKAIKMNNKTMEIVTGLKKEF